MKHIGIDFAPHSLRRTLARCRLYTWIVGLSGLFACMTAALSAFTLSDELGAAQHDRRIAQAEVTKQSLRDRPAKVFSVPESRIQAVNAAVAQLNVPWVDLLDAMEAATPEDIALLALEPDAKKRRLIAVGEAKQSDSMIAYVERLKQQPFFDRVFVLKHEVNDRDANRPIRFHIEAWWGGEVR